jgi:tetratricopeptide (TPR) repeat protein
MAFLKAISKGIPAGLVLLLAATVMVGCSSSRSDQEASALDFFKKGNAAFQKEDYRHAVRMYQQAATLDPRSPVIQYNLGLAFYQAQTYGEAVRAYSRALELDPTMAEAHRNMALAEDRLYNLESAQTHYNIYQAMMRERAQKAGDDAAAKDKSAGAPATAAAPAKAKMSAPIPGASVNKPASRAGQPEAVSALRRFDKDGKVVGSGPESDKPAKPQGGDGKWWTQDSSQTR